MEETANGGSNYHVAVFAVSKSITQDRVCK